MTNKSTAYHRTERTGRESSNPPIIETSRPSPANLTHTIAGAGDPSSSTQTPASAPICTCGTVIAVAEYDSQLMYRRCALHEKDSKGTWFIDELWEMEDPGLTLTPQGRVFRRELLATKNSDLAVKSNQKGGTHP